MSEKRIDDLRAILAKAAARDAELQRELEGIATDLLKELGIEEAPVWNEIKAGDKARQVGPNFVMEEKWLRGDLVIEVTPDHKLVMAMMIRQVPHEQHEVVLEQERSETVVIDPPDPKDRDKARRKFFDHVFHALEARIRESVDLRVT